MIKAKHFSFDFISELSEKLAALLPTDIETINNDLTKNFNTLLQHSFSQLDLVTHEEFDAQSKVLARSQSRIKQLEAKLNELEKLIEDKHAKK